VFHKPRGCFKRREWAESEKRMGRVENGERVKEEKRERVKEEKRERVKEEKRERVRRKRC
jgi:hypothetical protein